MKPGKIIFLLVFCFVTLLTENVSAQFRWVRVGVDGLTCSQCSRGVEMSLRKLDFVKDVEMNLQQTEGYITFADSAKVDVAKIAKAVTDAGFSVRFVTAGFSFDKVKIANGTCFRYGSQQFQFVVNESKNLSGEQTIRFIGKQFMPVREYRKRKFDLQTKCDPLQGIILFVTL